MSVLSFDINFLIPALTVLTVINIALSTVAIILALKNKTTSNSKANTIEIPISQHQEVISSDETYTDESFLVKVNEIINNNISNPEFSIAHLAKELCISRSGLFAKLKNITGDSPNNLIITSRLRKASELLESSELTITEISYRVGFGSPSYFAKSFSKAFGVSPLAWRNKKS